MTTAEWRGTVPEHRLENSDVPLSLEEQNLVLSELTNLLGCRHFKPSRRCSEFLDYVVRRTLKGEASSLKERALGIELYDRDVNYDTNSDPVVRATAGEVRKKIAQHYQESKPGRVRITLPVGNYVPRFEIQVISTENTAKEHDIAPVEACQYSSSAAEPPSQFQRRYWPSIPSRSVVALIALGLALAVVAISMDLRQTNSGTAAVQSQRLGSALETFWKPFMLQQADTVAVFSDLRAHSQMSPMTAAKYPIGLSIGEMASPGVSGVGEVMGLHALDSVFSSFNRSLRAKRSNFFTFDDALNENVIFLGSPFANPPLRSLQNNHDFTFQVIANDSGRPKLAIINDQPISGEPRQFLATPEQLPIKEDYALIALFPGMRPDERVLVLAGITTFGTQAAAEFVSRNDLLKGLISRLKVSSNGEIEPFEAVIDVKINDEVPIDERIVALHLK